MTVSFKNKKGAIQDILIIIMFIVIIFITIPIVSKVNTEMKSTFMQQLDANTSDYNSSEFILSNTQSAIRNFNIGGALLLVGLSLALIISAFFIETHPIFYFFILFVDLIFFIVIPIFSNIYTEIVKNPVLASEFTYFGIPVLIMEKLPLIYILLVAISLIVMFGKNAISRENTI